MGTISFEIYPHLKLVHFQGLGDISHDMLVSEIQQLHAHPDWNLGFNTFIDFEKAFVNGKTSDLSRYQHFFDSLEETVPVRKWAIFTKLDVPNNAFDMRRLPPLRNIIVDVFQSRDEALRFLNVLPHELSARSEGR